MKGGGGWALGLAVAACVKPGNANGRPPTGGRETVATTKVSAAEFARSSGTSTDRVLRYFRAWQNAAAQGLVAPADTITPAEWADADHIPTGYEWDEFYDASEAGSRPRDSRPEHAAQIIERRGAEAVVDTLTDEQVEEVVAAATERRPEAAQRGRTRPMVDRARAAGVLPAGGGDRLAPMPNEPDVTWMEIEREIGRMHSAIVLLAGWNTTHRETMAARVDELKREHELLGMVIDGARGLSPDDIGELLGES